MKTENGMIVEETFLFGMTQVVLTNPNSFFPNEVNKNTLNLFMETNNQLFKDTFNCLAAASREFYWYERTIDLKQQKRIIENYLRSNMNKTIMSEVGVSNKTVSELKNNKKSLDKMTIKTFERYLKCAVRYQNKQKQEKGGIYQNYLKDEKIKKLD